MYILTLMYLYLFCHKPKTKVIQTFIRTQNRTAKTDKSREEEEGEEKIHWSTEVYKYILLV